MPSMLRLERVRAAVELLRTSKLAWCNNEGAPPGRLYYRDYEIDDADEAINFDAAAANAGAER